MKVKYKTQYDSKKERFHTNIGDPIHVIYSGKYTDDGTLVLEEVGKEYIPDMVQSHAESVDINVILERYREGDTDALRRRQMMFGDFTLVPKTYADILNLSLRGEEYFKSLPLEVREKFDHDFAKFLANIEEHVKASSENSGSSEPKFFEEVRKRERASEEGEVEK